MSRTGIEYHKPCARPVNVTRSASCCAAPSAPDNVVVMTGGKWNSFDITARGTKLTVILNGAKMVDVDDKKYARGPIALQYGAGTVKFRNVRIRTL